MQGHSGEGNQSVDVDKTDDAALRTELSAIKESLHKLIDIIDCGRGSEKRFPLFIEFFGFLFNVFFLTEEIEVAVWI